MKNRPAGKKKSAKQSPVEEAWILKLYVAGQTPKSMVALAKLKEICKEYLHGKYRIVLVDVLKNPALAKREQIVALPTLVRQVPPMVKKLIGDLTNKERVLAWLDLTPAARSL